jgi:hypothetical protein
MKPNPASQSAFTNPRGLISVAFVIALLVLALYPGATALAQTPTPAPTATPCPGFFTENFDGVTAPALPPGWTATIVSGDPPTWVTTVSSSDTPPNNAFVPDQDGISDKVLVTPDIAITSAAAQITFRNNYNTEYDPPPAEVFWDGGVLEVSTNGGGTWADIIAAGGSFVSGGYTGAIDLTNNNPLSGRNAWSGNSGGYINTVINLPASFNGQSIRLRFRMGTDSSVAASGWHIDGLVILGSGNCGTPTPTPTPSPTPCPGFFTENFDGVTAPALPAGWTATLVSGDPPTWVTTVSSSDSAPNNAFVPDQDGISDKVLVTPDIAITSAAAQITFRNNYNTEYDPPPAEVFWDGGVLEVSTNGGGTWVDIIAAGGSFVSGGYTGAIDLTNNNPLSGRNAWSGNSGGYINTVINLPASFNGQSIRLRFRMGTDSSVAASGWHIDGLVILGSGNCGTPTPTPTPTATPISCGTQVVLYDQLNNASTTNATGSQNFEPANDAFDDQAADDFVVPGGQIWTVNQVTAKGLYFNGAGPADSFNVTFYADAATLPGAAVAGGNFTNLAYTNVAGNFTINLPSGVVLSPGAYWVSVQANQNFATSGQWAWIDRTVQSNNGAAWQNPGGGQGPAACTSWGRRGATCGIDAPAPDQVFLISGCTGGGGTPTPSPTASPTPTTTATPTPTPTPPAGTATPTPSTTPIPTATPSTTPSPTPSASPTPPTKAVNLSTRMRVQVDNNVGIGGFIITGSGPKQVILRAIGPSLTRFGIVDVLADPVLELHGPTGFTTITNDNWRDTQEQAIQDTGIPPTYDLESAIVATLNPGAYTGIVRGKNNASGVALIEVYDLDDAATSKLANLSTRAFVSTGDNIVIAGFLLSNGGASERVIARGIGPSLAPGTFPVSQVLADPTLELRDTNGSLVVSNNDWQDNAAQAAELMAAGLAPTNALESGIAATLPPGFYTALLAGLSNSTGIGVVEVYDLGP